MGPHRPSPPGEATARTSILPPDVLRASPTPVPPRPTARSLRSKPVQRGRLTALSRGVSRPCGAPRSGDEHRLSALRTRERTNRNGGPSRRARGPRKPLAAPRSRL
ncbi:hypothetical protein GCM10010231_27700 [Streptomyces sindenensis]|nr:hypothetical protein GCM10010231_27700 [Streptomyces sindenensis]